MESEDFQQTKYDGSLEIEKRRRVWYSVYVLDRLLSLQLGRPPAIHDDDYNVALPSRAGDSAIDWNGGPLEVSNYDGPSAGDYFIVMISFSNIVGRVLRSLYCPKRSRLASEDIIVTKHLDQQLLEWKMGLPRVLRFDLGHTFEQSYVFKRQARFTISHTTMRYLTSFREIC